MFAQKISGSKKSKTTKGKAREETTVVQAAGPRIEGSKTAGSKTASSKAPAHTFEGY
jgi:hypothetical protein